jgi:hypothetical protein
MIRRLLPLLVVCLVIGAAIGHSARPTAAAPYHCNQVNMHPSALALAQQNVAYSQHIWFTPANMYFCLWNVTGLPLGLTFTPGPNPNEGYITGIPTVLGTSSGSNRRVIALPRLWLAMSAAARTTRRARG